jgi:hypothetical protein
MLFAQFNGRQTGLPEYKQLKKLFGRTVGGWVGDMIFFFSFAIINFFKL